jgi:hypothetical protein
MPYLAWIRTNKGAPAAQIWYDLDMCEAEYKKGRPKDGRLIEKFEIKEPMTLPVKWVDGLLEFGSLCDHYAKLYPCPEIKDDNR